MSYKKAFEKMNTLPETQRKLGCAYRSQKNKKILFCAIGAICPSAQKLGTKNIQIKAIADPIFYANYLNGSLNLSPNIKLGAETICSIQKELKELDLTGTEAQTIQYQNDYTGYTITAEERFTRVLNFLKAKVEQEK